MIRRLARAWLRWLSRRFQFWGDGVPYRALPAEPIAYRDGSTMVMNRPAYELLKQHSAPQYYADREGNAALARITHHLGLRIVIDDRIGISKLVPIWLGS